MVSGLVASEFQTPLFVLEVDSKFMEGILIFVQIAHVDSATPIDFGCSFLPSKFT